MTAESLWRPVVIVVLGLALFAAFPNGGHLHAQEAAAAVASGLPAHIVAQHIVLSHTDPKRCLEMLKVFGYQTCEPGKPVDPAILPTVMVLPSSTHNDLPDSKKPFPQTDTDPVTNLLVFHDVRDPDQLSHLIHRVRGTIDVPARQIMIEAMVLEIASNDLEQLGVQWDLDRSALSGGNWLNNHTSGTLRVGRLVLPGGTTMADPALEVTATRLFGDFKTQLQALVVAKTARVVSRPSILTLDNRMAYINVSERIPVAESKFAGNNTFTQVSFREITAGIELTVRPRVSEDGSEIGMQIAASVTAQKPGEDVVIYATDAKGAPFEVARAPTLTVREVKTFARISDNTPFIIGGLVAEDDQKMQRRVPVLGSIPVVGPLFRTKDDRAGRREVIIVITPHVLPDDRSVARTLPKDVDDFDSFGAELFRDAYRIRAEDVFNLEFLTQNERLTAYQDAADRVVAEHRQLGAAYPISSFCEGRIPGERILVYRQIYEVIRRRSLAQPIDDNRLIFLEVDEARSDIGVGRLARYLERLSAAEPGLNNLMLPEKERSKLAPPQKALAMIFTERRDSNRAGDVMQEPVPDIRVVDCPSRESWEGVVWELNQPDEAGRRRFSVVLHAPDDVTRLKQAIVLRQAADLNAQTRELTLRNFALGRILLMPTVSAEKTYLIDKEVAEYFFYTKHYYRALAHELDRDMQALDELLTRPEFQRHRPPAAGIPAATP